ncbi:sensor histidine kinase [Marinifilum fragile]
MIKLSFVVAQSKDSRLKYLSQEDGLSSSVVVDIVQDNYGFIWFATRNGLNRYDGYSFKTFTNDPNNFNSIPVDRLTCLLIDKNGNFWIGSLDGLVYMDYDTETFSLIEFPENLPSTQKYINCLWQDGKNNIWIGTDSGLYVKRSNSKEIELHTYGIITDNIKIRDIVEDDEQSLWIASNIGLIKYETDKSQVRLFQHKENAPNGLVQSDIRKLLYDSENSLWICSQDSGVSRYLISEGRYINYVHSQERFPQCIVSNSIYDIIEDSTGKIWMASQGGGVSIYDKKNNTFNYFASIPNNTESLAWNVVLSLLEDQTGGIWLGTFGAGINYWHPSLQNFKCYGSQINSTGINVTTVYSIFDDGDKELWIAGFGEKSLNIYDKKNKGLINLKDEIRSNIVWIKADIFNPEEIVWIGLDRSIGFDLYKIDKNKKKILKKFKLPDGRTVVNDALQENDYTFWIATSDGLVKLNEKTGYTQHFRYSNSTTLYGKINCVETLNDTLLALGTNRKGLFVFNKLNGSSVNYKYTKGDSSSICDNTIRDLYLQGQKLWIATTNGLNSFDYANNKFKYYSKKDGFNSDFMSAIEEDNDGNLWVSSRNGVSCFNLKTGVVNNYDGRDGIKTKDYILGSSYKNKKGELFFGGSGVTTFEPHHLIKNPKPVSVVFTDMEVLNKPVNTFSGGVLNKVLHATDTISLSYKDKVISFNFAALEFALPQKTTYAYKLIGLDTSWHDIGNRRFVTFTTLPHGNYQLKVKAKNNAGVWSKNEANLYIHVIPPFYKTTWFKITLLTIILSLFGSFYYLRVRFLKKKTERLNLIVNERTLELRNKNEEIISQNNLLEDLNKELNNHRNHLEELVDERTAELREAKEKAEESERLKSSFLANMSHEIRTPMNAILGFSSLLSERDLSAEKKDQFIGIIKSNGDSLLGLIDNIMDLSKMEAGQIQLDIEQFDLNYLLSEIYNMFIPESIKEENNDIDFELIFPEECYLFESDSVRLKQIIINLLENAFKYTDKGEIKLGYEVNESFLRIFVKDTGIGIAKDNLEYIFGRFKKIEDRKDRLYRGTGLGLSIVDHLVNLLGAKIEVESTLGEGSCFYIIFELNHNTTHNITSNV